MKRFGFAAAFVLAGISFGAAPAFAGDDVEVVEATRVTYYLHLEGLDAAKVDALTARLKREFPAAQVEKIEHTLRIQTDGATFPAIEKVLAAEGVADLNHDIRKEPRTKVKVGELCEGCADCLAALLSKKFPDLGFLPHEGLVEVVAAKEDLERVEQFLRKLGEELKSKRHDVIRVEVGGDAQGRLLGPDGTIVLRRLHGADPRVAEKVTELERRLAEAKKAGRMDEAEKLERTLADVRASKAGMPRFDLAPVELEALRERLEHVKARLAAAEGNSEEREALEGARRRLEQAKEQLEAERGALARGGGGGRGDGKGPRPPVPPEPPKRTHFGDNLPFGGGRHDAPAGPLAEFRKRIHHLLQAAEHLNAAGYEGLAKQATEAAEGAKAEAQEAAKRLRAEEEARAAAMRKEHEARQAEREAARARERKDAEARDDVRRGAGLAGPKELGEIRAEELVDLVRALNQQINALREEMRALREQVGRDRPAPR